jgi:RNA polymerase-binding transcription factor DksA
VTGETTDDPLPPADGAGLQSVIVAARDRALAQLGALERDFDEIVESSRLAPPDDEHDPEGATIAYERAKVSALVVQAREDLAAFEVALRCLAAGRAPSCERCGGPITTERLMALPGVRTCIACASSRGR